MIAIIFHPKKHDAGAASVKRKAKQPNEECQNENRTKLMTR